MQGEGLLVDVPTGLGKTAMALDVQSIVLCQTQHESKIDCGGIPGLEWRQEP